MARLVVEADREIYYERYNIGGGRPVMLIHGWGMSVRLWDSVLPALLANGNEVVSFDHRCCGSSDKDFDDVSIDAIAADAVRLATKLDLRGIAVNGWSLGGAVAVAAAAGLGDRAACLVSTGGATPRYVKGDGWDHGGTLDVVQQTIGALRTGRAGFLHALAEGVCHADVGASVVEWMWQIFMQASPRADESLLNLAEIDQRGTVEGLQIPALVMCGDHDAIVDPEIGAACARMFADGKLVRFAGSGHAPFLEEQDKYCSELVDFINSIG